MEFGSEYVYAEGGDDSSNKATEKVYEGY